MFTISDTKKELFFIYFFIPPETQMSVFTCTASYIEGKSTGNQASIFT